MRFINTSSKEQRIVPIQKQEFSNILCTRDAKTKTHITLVCSSWVLCLTFQTRLIFHICSTLHIDPFFLFSSYYYYSLPNCIYISSSLLPSYCPRVLCALCYSTCTMDISVVPYPFLISRLRTPTLIK